MSNSLREILKALTSFEKQLDKWNNIDAAHSK